MNLKFSRLRPFDFIAAVLTAGLIAAAAVAAYAVGAGGSLLRVQAPTGEYIYDLGSDAQFDFEGPIGITRVEIADNRARVVSSPCREQICVNSRPLSKGGGWTACLPNRILLEVAGDDEAEVDAVSY